jgi:hypothetical protein
MCNDPMDHIFQNVEHTALCSRVPHVFCISHSHCMPPQKPSHRLSPLTDYGASRKHTTTTAQQPQFAPSYCCWSCMLACQSANSSHSNVLITKDWSLQNHYNFRFSCCLLGFSLEKLTQEKESTQQNWQHISFFEACAALKIATIFCWKRARMGLRASRETHLTKETHHCCGTAFSKHTALTGKVVFKFSDHEMGGATV